VGIFDLDKHDNNTASKTRASKVSSTRGETSKNKRHHGSQWTKWNDDSSNTRYWI